MTGTSKPKIWAHRGMRHEAPENSIASFKLAESRGSRAVELDVRMSADDIPVVIHDVDTWRVSGSRLVVRASTLAQLAGLPLLHKGAPVDETRADEAGTARMKPVTGGPPTGGGPNHFRIPSLDEVLSTLSPRTSVNIEMKIAPDATRSELESFARAVADCIRSRQTAPGSDPHMVSSFHPQLIDIFKALMPGTRAGWLMKHPLGTGERYPGRPETHDALHPHFTIVTPALLRRERDAGRLVNAWTVNHPLVAKILAKMGVNGLISDRPDLIARSFGI